MIGTSALKNVKFNNVECQGDADGCQETTRLVGHVLQQAAATLKVSGVETPRLDARCLLGHVLNKDPATLPGCRDDVLSPGSFRRFSELLSRRLDREPVSRILGAREFWSLSFALEDSVLDPRPDSETLVEAVLSTIGDRTAPLRMLDLGTGSGCLLAALLSELPQAIGVGVDIDPAALRVARGNLARNGLVHRAQFVCGNWGRALEGGFDIIVVNPPYIPSGEIGSLAPEVINHDPHGALFAGLDGLDAYRNFLPELHALLAAPGMVALEIGYGQSAAVTSLLSYSGFTSIECRKDLAGVSRCLLARPEASESQDKKGLGMVVMCR